MTTLDGKKMLWIDILTATTTITTPNSFEMLLCVCASALNWRQAVSFVKGKICLPAKVCFSSLLMQSTSSPATLRMCAWCLNGCSVCQTWQCRKCCTYTWTAASAVYLATLFAFLLSIHFSKPCRIQDQEAQMASVGSSPLLTFWWLTQWPYCSVIEKKNTDPLWLELVVKKIMALVDRCSWITWESVIELP